MRSSKSINSLANNDQPPAPLPMPSGANDRRQLDQNQINAGSSAANSPTSPICRCRVMYLGSSVPHITKDGLQGIQEPLRELYPDKATLASGNVGIDSWLSVWSNGILIENVDENGQEIKRFFKIDALHYCAAVKFVSMPINPYTTLPNGNSGAASLPKFLPLDSPHAQHTDSSPPIFASILRRTTGIKVLECHAFVCKRDAAANALVRCCFHAYADTMYAKQIGADVNAIVSDVNNNQQMDVQSQTRTRQQNNDFHMQKSNGLPPLAARKSKSIANLNDPSSKRIESWQSGEERNYSDDRIESDNLHDNDQQRQLDSAMIRRKSMNEHYAMNCDSSDSSRNRSQISNDNLRKQQKFSKSLHHLNQSAQPGMTHNQMVREYEAFPSNQSTSASCNNMPKSRTMHQVPQPFYNNPYASRVPSYPPESLIDATNSGGTLKSIKSMAANSIASTLLRSKRHAKAMSMAQLNQDRVTSFHQPHSNVPTIGGPLMMPPVPTMFLPNLQPHSIINGSQTMRPLGRPMMQMSQPMNFEAMTPKEMKKLLKKSAKYGIDPSKFGDNGLPLLPLRPPQLPQQMPPPPCHMFPSSKTGTMVSQSMFSDIYGNDIPDLASIHGLPMPRMPLPEPMDNQPIKSILVKPNPEFLKSKAGKKWLKQQKEFKKLLPPHLDGLPIIFGPPPPDALEPAAPQMNNAMPGPTFIPPHSGMPMMDSSGYYNPHPFYGQNGRASAASTLVRHSPHSNLMHDNSNGMVGPHHIENEHSQRAQVVYSNSMIGQPHMMLCPQDFNGDSSVMGMPGNGYGMVDDGRSKFMGSGRKGQARNHMVEQSVISLGDENDYEDDDDGVCHQGDYSTDNYTPDMDTQPARNKFQQSASRSISSDNNNQEHIMSNYQGNEIFNQQSYERSVQSNDDQSSYSSGIYKRGHINERAFSYSIRQEHKSGSAGINSDCDYANRNPNGIHPDKDHLDRESRHNGQHHPNSMFHNKQDQSNEYYHDNRESQTIPVNELTARLENQLNMKSFANSRIKSQM